MALSKSRTNPATRLSRSSGCELSALAVRANAELLCASPSAAIEAPTREPPRLAASTANAFSGRRNEATDDTRYLFEVQARAEYGREGAAIAGKPDILRSKFPDPRRQRRIDSGFHSRGSFLGPGCKPPKHGGLAVTFSVGRILACEPAFPESSSASTGFCCLSWPLPRPPACASGRVPAAAVSRRRPAGRPASASARPRIQVSAVPSSP